MNSALVQYKDTDTIYRYWYTMILWWTRVDQWEPLAEPYRLARKPETRLGMIPHQRVEQSGIEAPPGEPPRGGVGVLLV